MAFNKRNTSNTSEESTASNARESRTTIAYVNLSIPTRSGPSTKIANDLTIRLFAENPGHAALVDAIKEGHVSEEQAAKMIVASISLARDPDEPIDLDWSHIGL